MNSKAAVATVLNERLGRFLVQSRMNSQRQLSLISESVGLAESRILEIEEKPAQVPMCELAKVISYYGPKKTWEAQLLITDAQIEALQFNKARPTILAVLKSIRPPELREAYRKVAALIAGFLIWEALKHTFRSFVGGRLG